ncbi:helix-turn-helix domain-containing protein [Streptomyces sp. NPDC055025]
MLGAEVRYHRERKGMSQGELGRPLFVSGAFVGMLEMGVRRMQPEFAVKLDEIFGTGEFFVRNCEVLKKSKYPEHFAEAVEAEATAKMIKEYSPLLIPGLLQTESYARAIFRAGLPLATEDRIDELVLARLARGKLLKDSTEPVVWVVLDEAVLRRAAGGPAAMAEVLRHIAALVRRHRIIMQVLPFTAGAHAALEGAIKLMTFSDAPPLAYLEGMNSGQLVDDPPSVDRFVLTYDLLEASALSPKKSLALLESVAEDYAHEEQRE